MSREITALLIEQEQATAVFHAAVKSLIATVGKLDFPLGSPCAGYDEADIVGVLTDLLQPTGADWLEQRALDRVGETV